MKKHIIPTLLILVLLLFGYVNYIYPIMYTNVQNGELFYATFRYIILIFSYVLIIVTLLVEKENLEVFNIDNATILILIFIGIFRVKLKIPYEEYYRMICNFLSIIIFIYSVANWKKIPKTKLKWVLVGVLSFTIAFPLAIIQSAYIENLGSNSLFTTKPIVYVVSNFLFALTFVAPFEELIMRGVLWGQLRKWNISENKIIWIQGITFWLLHGYQIITPISFFVVLPIITIVFSILVKYSKQLFPSIMSHVLINTFGPFFIRIITRN